MSQVDRLLRLHGGTARRWIDGYRRGDRFYPPVVRAESTGADVVTWGEFVETRLLSEYRNQGVPLHRMRPVVERLREELNTPYPLAEARPFALGRELVAKVQSDVGLESNLYIVELRTSQLYLTAPADRFFLTTKWIDGVGAAETVQPDPRAKTVTIDPLVAFGEPAVRAVRTATIASEYRAGDSAESIADGYSLSLEQVNDAIKFELALAA
jgi:uncharacterized protein (DUF433 family)